MTTDTREDGAEGATDTSALVVCDRMAPPHEERYDCLNPRPAATIELPTSSASRCALFRPNGSECGYPLPCAAHPAPPEGTQGHE